MKILGKNDFHTEEAYVRYLHQQEQMYLENPEKNALEGIFHPFINYWYE